MIPLINLGKLIRGTLVRRPSIQIKSPYVADVSLHKSMSKSNAAKTSNKRGTNKSSNDDGSQGTIVLAHAPALDVGGMCVAGSEVYLSERCTGSVGATSHSIELVRAHARSPNSDSEDEARGVLVGAHPRLGELIAEEVLKRGLLKNALPLSNGFELGPLLDHDEQIPKKARGKRRKSNSASDSEERLETNDGVTPKRKIYLKQQVTLGDSRVDFVVTLTHPILQTSHRVVFEVKNVVCADYEAGTEPVKMGPNHCVVVAPATQNVGGSDRRYRRTALFPWSRTRGQTFEGRKVASERALKHLRNLESLVDENVTPVVLFVVNRSDCESVRACHESCPVFKEVLESAMKSGVRALGVRVRWTEEGECFYDGVVPVRA